MTPQLRFPEFTDEWQVKKLGDVAPLQRGFDLPNSQQKPGNYPIVFSNGPLKTHEKYMAKAPGVVTGRSGTIGKVHYIEQDYWPHNTSLWVTDFKGNSPKYIYYIYKRLHLERFSGGSSVPTLNRNDIHAQKIAIPQKPEQRKTADFLGGVDSKLTSIENKVAAMHEYKKGVMQALFSGKLRFKDENGNPYPDWEEKDFSVVLKSLPSKRYQIQSKEYSTAGKYPVVDQGQKLVVGYSDNDDKLFNSQPVIVFGDHTTILKFIDFDFVIGADGTKLLKPKQGDDIRYLYYFLSSRRLVPEGYKRHFSALKELSISIPSIEEQQKIADFLSVIDDKIKLEEAKFASAKEFKKALLQRMFV